MKSVLKLVMSVAAVMCVASLSAQKKELPVYLDENAPIEERVEDALQRMTLDEKIAFIHAQSKFSAPGVPRLGIPEVWCTDSSHGIREEVLWDKWSGADWTNDACTAFPGLVCLAATWDTEMASRYGVAIGEEARYRNKNVLLGPGVNIYRTPLCGRNHEYMGEDPYLVSTMTVPYIKGVQSNHVATCVKHFALNNQENRRHSTNVEISDRALYEIYLPAFKAATVDAGSWSIMGAYMKYKNQHCCHNQYLLNDILKGEWGWDGVVISDWGGTHDTHQAIYNGLDLEFGTWTDGLSQGRKNAYDSYHLADTLRSLVKSGDVPVEVLNDKVRRVLRLVFRTTMSANRPYGSFVSPEHSAAALAIAQGGIVLLKNENKVLPMNPAKVKKLLVVGDVATASMMKSGSSTTLKAKYEILPLDGIRAAYPEAEITYMKGYSPSKNDKVERVADIVAEARKADAVIFFGGLYYRGGQDAEGVDRASMELPYGQDKIVEALCGANPNFAVVMVSGTGVAMPWKDKVPAIVQGWHCGSEAGTAIASVLTGEVNPSGKLPYTYYTNLEQCGAHALGDYPGDEKHHQVYRDDIFVGYRYIDREGITPNFPFGHGLSYTTFEYDNVRINRAKGTANSKFVVSVDVTNSGDVDGKEIVQLYVSAPKGDLPYRAVKELKGFAKVDLKAGETKTVNIPMDFSSLAYFDEQMHDWNVLPGTYKAIIGASSQDLRGEVSFEIK